MKVKVLLTLSVSLFTLTISAAVKTNYSYNLLKNDREEILFPSYSSDEKKTVLDQSYLVLSEIFVHRDLKIEHFGIESDPLPLIKKMEGHIESYSDQDFHQELTSIFLKQNDLHTSYSYPKPYACYRSLLPFAFMEVTDLEGKKVIAVSKLSSIDEIKKLIPNLEVKVGDILLSYNSTQTYDVLSDLASQSSGANPEARVRRSVNLLSMKSHKYGLLPKEDTVDLVFKNRQGNVYTASIPWISRAETKCLKPEEEVKETLAAAEDDYQNDFNRIYRTVQKAPLRNKSKQANTLKTSPEPILQYKLIHNEFGDYGYIRLESFIPEKLTVDEVVQEVKKILLQDFANTDGLIFDLRNNGGGYIYLAEALVQLFTPKTIDPMNFKLKNSPANRHYMYETSPTSKFSEALRTAEQMGQPYTANLSLNTPEELDLVGQYYFKPVALFTNANCYSSCDMFSAQMQDHEAAIIFGEDSTTGAGGANNVSHTDVVKKLGEVLGPFSKLPGDQNIGFSFRQSIRVGKNAGKLIEDMGILSDKLAPTSLSDLYTDSGDQFKIISQALNEQALHFTSWVKVTEGREDILENEVPQTFIRWNDTEQVEFRIDRKTVSLIDVENSNSEGRLFELPKTESTSLFHTGKFEIIGKKNSTRTWRKLYQYRVIPAHHKLENNLLFNFESSEQEFLTVYNTKNQQQDGWVIKNGFLTTGINEEYADEINTEASIFLSLDSENAFILNFAAAVQTEKDFDFFRVKLVVSGEEIELIKGISGEEEFKDYSFDLSKYKGMKVEVRFIFTSDTGVAGKGVKIKDLSLKMTDK